MARFNPLIPAKAGIQGRGLGNLIRLAFGRHVALDPRLRGDERTEGSHP